MSNLRGELFQGRTIYHKQLRDGRWACAYELFGGRGRIAVGPNELIVEDNW